MWSYSAYSVIWRSSTFQNVCSCLEIRTSEVEYFQTRQLRVASDQAVPVELDGELVGNCPVEFRVQKRSLRVLTPV